MSEVENTINDIIGQEIKEGNYIFWVRKSGHTADLMYGVVERVGKTAMVKILGPSNSYKVGKVVRIGNLNKSLVISDDVEDKLLLKKLRENRSDVL